MLIHRKRRFAIVTPFLIWIGFVSRVSRSETSFPAVGQGGRTFQTNSSQHGFTVRIVNETAGDLEVSLQSGSQLIIQSRRWKYHLFGFIQGPDLIEGFGGSYLKPLVERFFDHLKEDCGCFESPPGSTSPTANRCTADVWKRNL